LSKEAIIEETQVKIEKDDCNNYEIISKDGYEEKVEPKDDFEKHVKTEPKSFDEPQSCGHNLLQIIKEEPGDEQPTPLLIPKIEPTCNPESMIIIRLDSSKRKILTESDATSNTKKPRLEIKVEPKIEDEGKFLVNTS
jgi:hypothetical protein